MQVSMQKIRETDILVEYQFETSKPSTKYVVENNKPTLISEDIAYGYCIFDKKLHQFTLDTQKTDHYFLQLNQERPLDNGLCKEIFYVYIKLAKIAMEQEEYPKTMCIATCG